MDVKINISQIRKDDSSIDGNALASYFKQAGAGVSGQLVPVNGKNQVIMIISNLPKEKVIIKLQEFVTSSTTCKPAETYLWENISSEPEAHESDVEFSSDGKTLLKCPSNLKGDYVVPKGTTCIGYGAFIGCEQLTSIYLPEGVTRIEYCAFKSCHGLMSVVLPKGLKSIKDNAFEGCRNLRTITLPKSLTNIGLDVFSCCENLKEIRVAKEKKERFLMYLSNLADIIIEE